MVVDQRAASVAGAAETVGLSAAAPVPDERGIVVRNLSKAYGDVQAVDDVSFDVRPGTVVGLLGPNGAGKTTIVHCLATLVRPDAGTAVVAGHDLQRDAAGVRSSIALTGQFAAVDDILTGRQNLELFGRLLRLPRRAAAARAEEMLKRFGLEDVADQPVQKYSGGTRRRLDLAVSVVVERPVLFLDEPTTGLDPRSRREVWEMVRSMKASGTAVLLTTQYLDEADELADWIVVVDRGRVIAQGTALDLKARVGGTVCELTIADETTRARARAVLEKVAKVVEADGVLEVPAASADELVAVLGAVHRAKLSLDDVAVRRPSLDDVFLALTGAAPDGGEDDS